MLQHVDHVRELRRQRHQHREQKKHQDPEHGLETKHPVGDEDVKDKDRHQEDQSRTKLMQGASPGQAGNAEQAGNDQ